MIRQSIEKGFTLLEFIFGSVVLIIAVVGLLAFFRSPIVVNEIARDTTIAMQDASAIIEQMRMIGFGSIQATDWDAWAQSNNAKNLESETIATSYSGTDPLEATVTVTWTRRGRTRDVRLTSRISSAVIPP